MIRRPSNAARALVALLAPVILVACRPVSVKPITPAEAYRARSAEAIGTLGISSHAARTLDRHAPSFGDRAADPEAFMDRALTAIEAAPTEDDPELMASLAELAMRLGEGAADARESPRGLGFSLLAASLAWDGLTRCLDDPRRPTLDPGASRLMTLYNRAVARFVARLETPEALTRFTGAMALGRAFHRPPSAEATRPRHARFMVAKTGAYAFEEFDRMRPSDTLRVNGLARRHRRVGLGLAMVASRENPGTDALAAYAPPEGSSDPATLLLRFGPRPAGPTNAARSVSLELLDPRRHAEVRLGAARVPVAADWSAPFADWLSRSPLRLQGIAGTVRPQLVNNRSGVFLLEPYDPKKTPVLMVHGLLSSPEVFVDITNEIFGDPRLRRHLQVWHYNYPTGMPFPWAARDLRRRLDILHASVDPEDDDPAWRDMVILAHSMGGLLARLLITDSGDAMWSRSFAHPLADLTVEPQYKKRLDEIFFFDRRPYVNRVVFMATPHRGAERAGGALGRAANRVITLPLEVRDLFAAVLEGDRSSMTPEMAAILARGVPSSIQTLRSDSPAIRALEDLPPHPDVILHSILGDRGSGAGLLGTDGYVAYRSAHLARAVSELVVPAGHAVYEHPKTTIELRRILEVHVATRAPQP